MKDFITVVKELGGDYKRISNYEIIQLIDSVNVVINN